ncbi:MAG TPA: branched-chain amino acid ABC transporter substrate-binding protein [Kineosporiaceae bacterium]|nr:branched-chain amino acid ABC transporter substrate-binding protein [Kineosporiaceae bacterium]
MLTLGGRQGRTKIVVAALAAGALAAGVVAALPADAAAPAPAADAASAPVVVGVDLPFQGSNGPITQEMWTALQVYVKSIGGKAGTHPLTLKRYDDSTAAAAKWDPAQCLANAQRHLATKGEVAVVGPFNSGCAKIEVPVLAGGADGPLLMVSPASTNPGLTKPWDLGEPGKYQPGGVRTYARVLPTDDKQGTAAARYAKGTLHSKRCAVLDDRDTYGKGVADAFVKAARGLKLPVVFRSTWDGKAANYTALMKRIKAKHPDCLYLGGIYDNNGARLLADKVRLLGSNTAVKVLADDGFTGFPELDASPAGAGLYATFAGTDLPHILAKPTAVQKAFVAAYTKATKKRLAGSYALYAVAALQVVVRAVATSDGTRQGVHDAVLSGPGITLPAAASMTGRAVAIDPATGDIRVGQMTVERIVAKQERFVALLDV